MVSLSPLSKLGLKIQDLLLKRNKGVSMDFILGRLPYAKADIFVDASSTWGIGGCYGEYFFYIPQERLVQADSEIIARKELLACLVAVLCFGDLIKGQFVQLYTDNMNAFNQLRKGRSSNIVGMKYLALWEYAKYRLENKIKPLWIPSDANVTADRLSRGTVPEWLSRRGHERTLSQQHWKMLTLSPIKIWKRFLRIY